MKTPKIEITTIANAMDVQEVFNLVYQLDEVLLPMGSCNKEEQGEYLIDFTPEDENDDEDIWDGHCITYNIGKQNVFFAMAHSNGTSYLVRADKNLIQVA